jgi:hypothetical protein
MASAEKPMARKASARSSDALHIDLFVHGAQIIDHQRGVELMNSLTDSRFDGLLAACAVWR